MNNEKIAIVGIGVIAPNALNKEEFWNNVLNRKNCITEVPKDRWDWKLYYDPDPKAPDKTYSKIGGFVQGFKFDPIKYKIPPNTSEQISRLQKMTIEATRMALEDSGYASWDKPMTGKQLNPERTAVVLGNAMGAMQKEFTDLKVYKFYNEDILKKTSSFAGLEPKKQQEIIKEYEKLLDEYLLKITEDTMPGELSNVTAGRIANVFNFNGPNLTLDAACASSMAALDYAVMGLRTRKFDTAICGGADEMMSPAAYVKFCKIGALSPDGSRPFDEGANGFVMGEAVGIYLLKRLSDAIRDNDRIYALINTVGASSDGKGKGITAPNPKGQALAIKNAFAQLDYGPADIDLVECHGTSTVVGDASEIEVLKEVFGPYLKNEKKIGITSVKSQIGHTKAAAGSMSIIKTALALFNKTLPPSINFEKPNPKIDFNLFKVITKPEEWKTGTVRRANVSAFGFGGTNFHVAMEEYKEGTEYRVESGEKTNYEDPKFPYASLQGEAVTFYGDNPEDLKKRMDSFVNSTLNNLPENHPMILFSHKMNSEKPGAFGVSIVAKSPEDLKEKIGFFFKNANPEVWQKNTLHLKMKGIYPFKYSKNKAKTGYIFPGQGSQYVDMMRDLAYKYQIVRDTFDEADRILEKMINTKLTDVLWSKPGETKEELEKRESAIKQTQMTQPAVMTADMAMFRLLESFGIKPDMAIGHSLGEYAAVTAAGVFTLENGLRAVTSRAKEMSNVKVKDPGKMASVAWPVEKVEKELKKIKGYVICANKNCPTQTVIAGEKEAVDEAVKMFNALGAQAQEIPVSHAFHSAIIEPAIGPYRQFLERIPISTSKIPILSNVTADYFPNNIKGIYDLLVRQMVSPVEFIKQLERMYKDGVRIFIECGPKRVLSALATSTLKDKTDITVLASNHPKRGGITEFNDLIANLISLGVELNWKDKEPMTSRKLYNPYYLNWIQEQGIGYRVEGRGEGRGTSITTSEPKSIEMAELAEKFGFNFNNIAVSGIAGGTPGTWDKLFREKNLDEILNGHNMIEVMPKEWQAKQIDKNIIRVVKSATGHHRIEKLDTIDEAIKLSARRGHLDIETEFGIPNNVAKALNSAFKMAIGAGILALKDAGIPLIHYYKKTTTGGYLPEKWALPEPMASETGVIFASAFPVLESLITEITNYFVHKYRDKSVAQMWEIYDAIINKLSNPQDKQYLRNWMEQHFGKYHSGQGKDTYTFSQNFLLKVITIADSQFAQWVGAKGPIIHLGAACSSTTQAVHVAESWIRAGKAKRVVVIASDDITNEIVQEWVMPGFVASGTATTKGNVSEAALPFDRRRHGLIVGAGAVGMVIEDETLIRERGMKPLVRVLLTEAANSAFHVTRLDTEHIPQVMDNFLKKIEKIYGLNRSRIASKTLFMSHETYTPARGGSASAEVQALKKTFGPDTSKVIVSNVKGFTGHTMGASLEDVVAIRALNTGIVPPIANYREPDPELAGINLSKGGRYDFEYALRFAAGFGSHMAMSFMQRTWREGEPRIENEPAYKNWLKKISGDEHPELEVAFNTLRIKDKKTTGIETPVKEPAIKAVESGEWRVESGQGSVVSEEKPQHTVVAELALPETQVGQGFSPAYASLKACPTDIDSKIKVEILNMVAEKTGYPKDMLDLDLDMEADLGIDTVKQAELFAMIRDHYQIPRKDNLSLKDYPTIRHCIKFVMDEKGIKPVVSGQGSVDSEEKPQHTVVAELALPETQVGQGFSPAYASLKACPTDIDSKIKVEILNMVAEKTGYPKDMLDLDLDMEADLGIDTVKQAELFAMIRDHYQIPRKDNLSLKDYPTIRHCIKFVMDETGIKSPVVAELALPGAQTTEHRQQNTDNRTQVPAPSTPSPLPSSPKRHIRYVPTVIQIPAEEEIKKLSAKRPVVIFSDEPELTKCFKSELNKLRIDSFVFTSLRTKDAVPVDWNDVNGVENAITDFARKHADIQGVFYLLGCASKKLDKNTNAFDDLKRWAMPMFFAAKHFNAALSKTEPGYSTFFATVTKVDGALGYKTDKSCDPIYGAINGINLCLRKEIEKSVVKLIDFPQNTKPETVADKTFYELLRTDKRLAVGYESGKRCTIITKPDILETTTETMDLRGKTLILTGGGRGLGAKFAEIMAKRYKPAIIILDIINLNENSSKWAAMSEEELKTFKTTVLWEELKRKTEKPTPAMLEKEFTKIHDSALLYKTIENLKSCGSRIDYHYCDVNNPDIFNSVLETIKKEYGHVDGFVHFAGLERSKLIVDKTTEEFFAVFNTKANSAINFWKSGIVRENGFFVMISSIAGKYGNMGQSDYAAASDYISKLSISLSNKGIRALAVDMTAYADIGMAMRPGVEAFLKSQQLEFIYPDEGMNAIADEIVYGKIPEIVLSGSLGKLDWDKQLEFNPDFHLKGAPNNYHFVGKVTKQAEGSELTSVKTFSIENDPYLKDHSINKTPYVPGVMGIETFAQTLRVFTGKTPGGLADVHYYMPIKLLRGNPLEVRITCVSKNGKPEMKMESEFISAKGVALGRTRTHFTARAADLPETSWNKIKKPAIPKTKKFKVTSDIIYKTYFHGPSFQVLGGILSLEKDSVTGLYIKPKAPLWTGKNPDLLFHPMLIEAAFQTCGYRDIYFEKKLTLPDAVGRVIIHNSSQPPETMYTHAVYKGQDSSEKSIYDVFVFDENGEIWVELQDYLMIPTGTAVSGK